jgi:hypothetical protein
LRIRWAAVATLVITAACSSATHPTVTTVPVDYGAKYLALVAPLNAATAALDRAETSKAVVPADVLFDVVRATSTFDSAVLAVPWPGPSTMTDVRALTDTEVTLSNDLSLVDAQNALTVKAYRARLAHDRQAANAATGRVRADLHLPVAPPQPTDRIPGT